MIYQELQSLLGHTFYNSDLLEAALTHRSFYFENRGKAKGHFERYEFLGDAVLGLVLGDLLMHAYLQNEEGDLSKWRASLVNENTLAEMANEWNLGQLVRLGKSEDLLREHLSPRLLSSVFEAVVGALYLDAGFEKTKSLLTKQFSSRLENLSVNSPFEADYKTRLQEFAQKKFKVIPRYHLVHTDGPDHSRVFHTEVRVASMQAVGTGSSRKTSEQEAARQVLEQIEGEQK